ncbi:MAG: hypothetical protein Q8J89_17270 [Caulobacter sp.]|nr:hypothetical protein [Caulobacter sp.]
MLQTLTALPPTHIAYLATAAAAFTLFGATLCIVHVWTNLPTRHGS